MQAQGNTKMKPPKKQKPKAHKEIQAAQTADAIRETLQPMLAHGRSLSDFEPLMIAEQMLLHACRMGEIAAISELRPEQATEQNTVRAGFLRFLLLGGDARAPIHEQGVQLKGSWIEGELNLEDSATVSAINCNFCVFTAPLILRRSTLPGGLFLQGSKVHGIQGDGLATKGSVMLRDGFFASAEVRLVGAQIEGNLECSDGHFDYKHGFSLCFDNAVIQGGVFLDNGFLARGTVRLIHSQIGSGIECRKCQFDNKDGVAFATDGAVIKGGVNFRNGFHARGEVRMVGTQIDGDFVFDNVQLGSDEDFALVVDGTHITGSFFFKNLTRPLNNVSLASASAARLIDDCEAWGSSLILNGFTYATITGGAPTTATARLAWLDKQRPEMSGLLSVGTDFCPQPWRHLQKVLHEMGHTEDARQIAIAFEDRLRQADLIGLPPANWPVWRKWPYRLIARGFHYGFGILTGYGYRPMRLLAWFFGVWLGCAIFYWCAALQPNNVFAPSNPLVFQEATYAACVPGSDAAKREQVKPADAMPAPVKGAGNWYLCEKLRAEYTGFSPLAYSLDVILPLVDLQQQKDWSPMIPTPKAVWWQELRGSGWKHITRMVVWAETLFGWLASLLLVAIVSGLTKRRED